METKQVIIQNKDEERQFLKEAEKRNIVWDYGADPVLFAPSNSLNFINFPIIIQIESSQLWNKKTISWNYYFEPLTVKQFLES